MSVDPWFEFRESLGQHPLLIKGVDVSSFDADLLFQLLLAAAKDERGLAIHPFQMFRGAGELLSDYLHLLPRDEDGTLERYFGRLESKRKREEITGFVFGVERYSRHLFADLYELARRYYSVTHRLRSGAFGNIFFGRYHGTPSGVHRGPTATLSVVVTGCKQYAFWDANAFDDMLKEPSRTLQLRTRDIEPLLNSATIIEGRPGDVIYWPASHWHMGFSEDPDWVSTINLALVEQRDMSDWILRLAGTFPTASILSESEYAGSADSRGLAHLPDVISRNVDLLAGVFQSDDFRRRVAERWVAEESVLGLYYPPSVNDHSRLCEEDVLRNDGPFDLIASRDGADLLIGACGSVARVAYDDGLVELLRLLANRNSFRVKELLGEFSEGASAVRMQSRLAIVQFLVTSQFLQRVGDVTSR